MAARPPRAGSKGYRTHGPRDDAADAALAHAAETGRDPHALGMPDVEDDVAPTPAPDLADSDRGGT